MATASSTTTNLWADWAGMVASVGCAIHCAAMPFVLAYLPTLGLSWLADEAFHRWMALICFGLAASAFVPGWRRHGSFIPAAWGAAGLILLTTSAFGLEGACCDACASKSSVAAESSSGECAFCDSCSEDTAQDSAPAVANLAGVSLTPFVPYINPLGGLLLVVGHVMNHRKSCGCQGDSCCLSNDESGSLNTIS